MATRLWSTAVNQRLLEKYGFTGKAGTGAGSTFLDTLSVADQYSVALERRQYAGQENYTRPALQELEKGLFSTYFNNKSTNLSDFYSKFQTGNAPQLEQAPSKGAGMALRLTADEMSKKSGRRSTIKSDFNVLENINKTSLDAKALYGS